MELPTDAHVSCHDGRVGKSTYVIVDPLSQQVTHFVVKTEKHGHEFLVPLAMVTDAERGIILLDCRKDDVYKLPLFDESWFHGADDFDALPPLPSPGLAGSSTRYHPYRPAEAGTEGPLTHSSVGSLAVNKGAHVLATDGRVGIIDEFVIDPDTHRITHMVLRRRNLLDRWIITTPVSAIERVETDSVYLNIDKDAVKALPTVTLRRFPWE